MKDVETGERGFVITGKDQCLEPYHEGVAAVGPELATMRSSLGDAATVLSDLVTARLQEAADGIASYRRDGPTTAAAKVDSGVSKAAMDAVRVEVARLQRGADARIVTAQADRGSVHALRALSLGGLVLSAVTLGYVAFRRLREQRAGQICSTGCWRTRPWGSACSTARSESDTLMGRSER